MNVLSPDESLHACLDEVRRLDHDRFLTTLLAPAASRARLIALYAFNVEIARVREAVTEPMLGQIRLQWWREAIEALAQGEARAHEAAVALSVTWERNTFPARRFLALIDARERDLTEEPFADLDALESYAEATSSMLMLLAAEALAGPRAEDARAAIGPAGKAYALTGLLRALPVHASQGRLYLPLDLLRRHDIDPHRIFAGDMSDPLRAAVRELAGRARELLAEARTERRRVDRVLLPALLPMSLCDGYLKMVMEPGFDPFRDATGVPAFVLQSRLIGRKLLGRF